MPTAAMDVGLIELARDGGKMPALKKYGEKAAPAPDPAAAPPEGAEAPPKPRAKKDPFGEIEVSPRRLQPQTMKSLHLALKAKKSIEAGHEGQHWESCGKQVASIRGTRPNFCIGRPNEVVPDVRCSEICDHPTKANPGPVYNLSLKSQPTNCLRGFGSERRFLEDPQPFIKRGQAIVGQPPDPNGGVKVQIVHSTCASAFSPTFPYVEPPSLDKTAKKAAGYNGVSPRCPAVTDPDLNHQHYKYNATNPYSFGSSCTGHRFPEGHSFSRKPPQAQHAPRQNFRDQREHVTTKAAPGTLCALMAAGDTEKSAA